LLLNGFCIQYGQVLIEYAEYILMLTLLIRSLLIVPFREISPLRSKWPWKRVANTETGLVGTLACDNKCLIDYALPGDFSASAKITFSPLVEMTVWKFRPSLLETSWGVFRPPLVGKYSTTLLEVSWGVVTSHNNIFVSIHPCT